MNAVNTERVWKESSPERKQTAGDHETSGFWEEKELTRVAVVAVSD